MGVHEHTVRASVDPKVVWERWTNTDLWPSDDPAVAKAKLNGPVAKGALGMVRWNGRKATFRIVEVDRQKMRFGIEAKALLATLRVDHLLDQVEGEGELREFTHRLTITGPLARLWDRLVGRRIADGMPTVMGNIVGVASLGE